MYYSDVIITSSSYTSSLIQVQRLHTTQDFNGHNPDTLWLCCKFSLVPNKPHYSRPQLSGTQGIRTLGLSRLDDDCSIRIFC